ncbi:MAG: very short patch repair endonuclease [Candidatus Pacebacteria bacterium]|nr:very short patch repair endonuclease [Candidatus Paceibacterota bacterium]
MDKVSKEQRSRNMAAVPNRNSQPELIVRRALHRLGYRFRLHRKDLPGTPDIVLATHRLCIFVHGCFWHRHEDCRRSTVPSTNTRFWLEKFAKNKARDQDVTERLTAFGWRVEVIWTCETTSEDKLLSALRRCLERRPSS